MTPQYLLAKLFPEILGNTCLYCRLRYSISSSYSIL